MSFSGSTNRRCLRIQRLAAATATASTSIPFPSACQRARSPITSPLRSVPPPPPHPHPAPHPPTPAPPAAPPPDAARHQEPLVAVVMKDGAEPLPVLFREADRHL